VTEVPTWVIWLIAVISPLLTFGAATAGVVLTRRGVNEAIAESRVARQQAGEIAERQAAQSRRDGLMEYGKMAVDLLLSDKPDLMTRGEAMIAYLSSLPPEILPAEDRDLLIAMMTVGVARGEYSGVIGMVEPATSAPSGSAVSANTADEA
jgi:hypothetical protein